MRARSLALTAVLLLLPWRATAQVRLNIRDGRVSLSARNATVAHILAEWAKAGPTRIVNGDRVVGAPVTMELVNVTEVQALDILLRSTGGYLLAPRPVSVVSGSRFDRILILPVAGAPRTAAPPAPAARATETVPQAALPAVGGLEAPKPDAADPAAGQVVSPRAPIFQIYPVPPAQPNQAPSSAAATAPVGVATPGMMPPTPTSTDPADTPR